MRKNKQRIVLETSEGTARSEEQLKEVWESRLKELNLKYYKVVSAKILSTTED